MSKLDEAQQRLQRAVSELEEAARARAADSAPATTVEDAAALEAANRRAAALESRSAAVSERLDATIGRLRQILEN